MTLQIKIGSNYELVTGLASYISDYVNEELRRGHEVTEETINNAVDAYNGGAR